MVSVNGIEVSFAAKPLLKSVSFVINKGDKIALTGKNGAGKSTLLKIIAGLQEPTGGNISKPSDFSIGYLPQQMKTSDNTTLIEEVRSIFQDRNILEKEIEKLHAKLEGITDFESREYYRLFERLEELNIRLQYEISANNDAEIEKILIGLGFGRDDFDRPTAHFSGGWRMRVEIAKLLLKNHDLLLLDEPTNHLDIESIRWMEQFLKVRNTALLLVSHDRDFLDNVTNRTIEINCGQIHDYNVNYSQFVELRKERLEQQIRAYNNQQKQIAEIKDFIEKFRYKATKAVQVQSRIKQLEKIIPIEVDEVDRSAVNIKFPPAERSGDFPLILEGVSKRYGENLVFQNAEFTIRRGEKVAFVGKNGEGKSTLVKCIMNQVDYDGSLKIGHNIRIGYFAQNQAQLLDENLSVFETIDNVAVGDIRSRIKDLLAAFLFRGEDIDKKVSVLSGGEKTRLAMIKLLLQPVNFLILDEPTNHLDMRTKEILKNALKDFNGTLIVVSHDRNFLDGLVEKVYEFGGKRVVEHLGGVYDFLRKKEIADFGALEYASSYEKNEKTPEADAAVTNKEISSSKETYLQQKEKERKIKRIEKNIQKLEEEIEKIETTLSDLEAKMAEGDTSSDIIDNYSHEKNRLAEVMNQWESLQMELEEQ